MYATRVVPHLSRAALAALSIPFSNASVERTFSVLSNRKIDNRLSAGDRYVTNMMMLACDAAIYRRTVAERVRDVAPAWSALVLGDRYGSGGEGTGSGGRATGSTASARGGAGM